MKRNYLVAILVVVLFVACTGGGQEADPTTAPVSTSTTALAEPTSPSPTVSGPAPTMVESPPATTSLEPTSPSPTAEESTPSGVNFEERALQMQELINEDRVAAGLSPVEWAPLAAEVAREHAEEMAAQGYLSHWNLEGQGPDVRFALAGGTAWVQENVYRFWKRYEDGTPVPITDWEQVVIDAQNALMESPGHRDNILNPAHTHVGVGIAYNVETGDVSIAQEFLNRYIRLDPLPEEVEVGEEVVLSGMLLQGAEEPLINLAYQPFPDPMTVEELMDTSTYISPAEPFFAAEPEVDEEGHFSTTMTLDMENQPGLYHIRIWVEVAGNEVQATNAILRVR